MKNQRRVFIYAEEVCVKRSLDAAKLQNYLRENDYKQVFHPEEADIFRLSANQGPGW